MRKTTTIVPGSACNLCRGTDAVLVSSSDRHPKPLRTLLCRGCGLMFSDPRPEEAAEQDYYRDQYRQEYKGIFLPRPVQAYRSALDGYTNARHYLGGTLLRQQLSKLGRNAREWWMTRGVTDPVEAIRLWVEHE